MSNHEPKPCPNCGRDWITRVQGSTVGTLGDIVCEECGLRTKSLEQWDALPRREDFHAELMRMLKDSFRGYVDINYIKGFASRYAPREPTE